MRGQLSRTVVAGGDSAVLKRWPIVSRMVPLDQGARRLGAPWLVFSGLVKRALF
jgi:hypothetical protein